jgi:hypothetical protein
MTGIRSLFHFKDRRLSRTMETVPLTVLAMITQCIVSVAIYKDGNFSPISALKSITAFEPSQLSSESYPPKKIQ